MTTKPAFRRYLSSPMFFCPHHPRGTLRRCVKRHHSRALNVQVSLALHTNAGFVFSVQTHCEPASAPKRRKAPTPHR